MSSLRSASVFPLGLVALWFWGLAFVLVFVFMFVPFSSILRIGPLPIGAVPVRLASFLLGLGGLLGLPGRCGHGGGGLRPLNAREHCGTGFGLLPFGLGLGFVEKTEKAVHFVFPLIGFGLVALGVSLPSATIAAWL